MKRWGRRKRRLTGDFMNNDKGEILIYKTGDGITEIDVRLEDETVWLTQQQLADLYQSSKSNVSEHIKHIKECHRSLQEPFIKYQDRYPRG